MKIISLVPSITETLFDFGLTQNEIIGRTKFCIHPKEKVQDVKIIGGTKNINVEAVRHLQPDLIIASKEENEKDHVEELQQDFTVWVTDIKTLKDNDKFLAELGKILDRETVSQSFIQSIQKAVPAVSHIVKTAYLIWQKPYMTVGNDTFINDVMKRCGFLNIFSNKTRYPEISLNDLEEAELILLSTEPYPFREKHKEELAAKFPTKKIMLADGEAFSWYGTHLAKREQYFTHLRRWVFG